MLRTTKILGLCIVLCAMTLDARSADTATFQVSLTIRESCLVESTQASTGAATRPQVSCRYQSPHLTRQMPATTSAHGASLSSVRQTPAFWLVMF